MNSRIVIGPKTLVNGRPEHSDLFGKFGIERKNRSREGNSSLGMSTQNESSAAQPRKVRSDSPLRCELPQSEIASARLRFVYLSEISFWVCAVAMFAGAACQAAMNAVNPRSTRCFWARPCRQSSHRIYTIQHRIHRIFITFVRLISWSYAQLNRLSVCSTLSSSAIELWNNARSGMPVRGVRSLKNAARVCDKAIALSNGYC